MATKGSKVTFWAMVRDVLLASLNKGQFPIAVFGIVLIVLVAKMSQDSDARLVFELETGLANHSLLGWTVAVLLGGGWAIHARRQRRKIQVEMDRLASERDELQRTLGAKVKSSRRGP